MLVLAIECSTRSGSVALKSNDRPAINLSLDDHQRSAESLVPAVQRLLRQESVAPSDIDLVAVTIGPGSFTGLRVGVTAAKCFAYATGCGVHAINTLRVLAAQVLDESHSLIAPIIDAQRGQLFTARFARSPQHLAMHGETRLISPEQLLEELPDGALVTGSGIRLLTSRLARLEFADEAVWHPTAATVASLTADDAAQPGFRPGDPYSLLPVYNRPSAAEEKRK